MARQLPERDISALLGAAKTWIDSCLIRDASLFSESSLWTLSNVKDVNHAFVEHPDFGPDDFMTKLARQMTPASSAAQKLMAEMLWVLLLFPSNMRSITKRLQIQEVWRLSKIELPDTHPMLIHEVLFGVGSGGPGFNNYRPQEMEFLISIVLDLKRREVAEREKILTSYEGFISWMLSVPQKGKRQFRHMLRYFSFPDRVERMSSNRDRRKILEAFGVAKNKDTELWNDDRLDGALQALREKLEPNSNIRIFDFYEPSIKAQWSRDRKIKTPEGERTVSIPADDEEGDDEVESLKLSSVDSGEERQSIQMQAKLAEIGAKIGFKIWVPAGDRVRVRALVSSEVQREFLDELPINFNDTTVDTVKLIDVLWLKRSSVVRAFEVEHTTAVFSGLLRMADLLALQPNLNIQLHIVAPDERRDKVFREMRRPVFSILDGGALSEKCTFIPYESVTALSKLEHLSQMKDSIVEEYEESPIE